MQQFIAGFVIALLAVVPLIVFVSMGVIVSEALTGGYLDNVIFNQVGTFPRKEIGGETALQYALRKIPAEARDILVWEGSVVVLGILGLFVFLRYSEHPLREYIGWFAFFSWCSIIYTAKGGTMDYIFTIGEPWVALFAGFFLCWFYERIKRITPYGKPARPYWQNTKPLLRTILYILLFVVAAGIAVQFNIATLKQRTYEMPATEVKKVTYFIEKHSNPDDVILSPPYFAFLTQRRLIEDYSELYIWYIKYLNETVMDGPGEGIAKVTSIRAALEEQRIPIVILNMRTTGTIPEIRNTIDEYYERLLEKPFRTLNTELPMYVPRQEQ